MHVSVGIREYSRSICHDHGVKPLIVGDHGGLPLIIVVGMRGKVTNGLSMLPHIGNSPIHIDKRGAEISSYF